MPRARHAMTIVGERVFLHGGTDTDLSVLDDFYELNMCSLTWTKIQATMPGPQARYLCSMNAVLDHYIVLHGGDGGGFIKSEPISDTWIMDIRSHTWRKYTLYTDHPRKHHTGTTGPNSCVTIIGGNYYLSDRLYKNKSTFQIILEPKSLQHLALQTIYMHQTQLPWKCLPQQLIALLGISDSNERTQDVRSLNTDTQVMKL